MGHEWPPGSGIPQRESSTSRSIDRQAAAVRSHTAYLRLNDPVAVAASASLQGKHAINVAPRKHRILTPGLLMSERRSCQRAFAPYSSVHIPREILRGPDSIHHPQAIECSAGCVGRRRPAGLSQLSLQATMIWSRSVWARSLERRQSLPRRDANLRFYNAYDHLGRA